MPPGSGARGNSSSKQQSVVGEDEEEHCNFTALPYCSAASASLKGEGGKKTMPCHAAKKTGSFYHPPSPKLKSSRL